ncbi:F0F1 ATP synthase subunit gamma [uncultured Ferrovibrio sp.]|jgi:F-type H+-transporting ATPase subunit gamma|uniref:F0F1 ATP synthase subunit gamma n=1 Tax=uncultured Ferrovibrio sp. TaxID=1576913 RepID=UPI002629A626|nr:F0F1 ATP synthase subunit gamma [uncultured Ferrovibrio sp.]
MPSLKSLRVRINSVKSTQKITKAMKMVAASKLRRAQEAAEQARPYAERMAKILSSLAAGQAGAENAPRLLVGTGSDQVHLLVVATAERGLCGAFNSSIVKLARRRIDELTAAGKTVKILCVGKKGRDQLRRDHASKIVDTLDLSKSKKIGFAEAQEIADRVLAMFEAGEFDVATIFFNNFKSVISQIPTAQQLIPAMVAGGENAEAALDLGGAIYEFEPDEETILTQLLPRNLSMQVYRALLENAASEQGARMTAMDNATRNAGEMIKKLTLNYNRSRQAQITKELIEIISGAEAV